MLPIKYQTTKNEQHSIVKLPNLKKSSAIINEMKKGKLSFFINSNRPVFLISENIPRNFRDYNNG